MTATSERNNLMEHAAWRDTQISLGKKPVTHRGDEGSRVYRVVYGSTPWGAKGGNPAVGIKPGHAPLFLAVFLAVFLLAGCCRLTADNLAEAEQLCRLQCNGDCQVYSGSDYILIRCDYPKQSYSLCAWEEEKMSCKDMQFGPCGQPSDDWSKAQ